jgi:hypothetical protein
MHQPTESGKQAQTTKTIIAFETILNSSVKIGSGTGGYVDLTNLTAALKFCEEKVSTNPRLGFKEELRMVRVSFSNILHRALGVKEPSIDNWTCPFVTKVEQKDLQNLMFLLRNQFIGAPLLETDIPLDDHFRKAQAIYKENL